MLTVDTDVPEWSRSVDLPVDAESILANAAARAGRLPEKDHALLDGVGAFALCQQLDELLTPVQRISTFVEAQLAAHGPDAAPESLLTAVDQAWAAIGAFAERVERLLTGLPDDVVHAPELQHYRNHVEWTRASAASGGGPSADSTESWQNLARQLLAGIEVDGGERSLATALPVLYSADRAERSRTNAAVSAALAPQVALRATALTGLADAHRVRESVAGAPDWLHGELLANQLDKTTLTATLDRLRDGYAIVHDYYRAKRAILGHPATEADRYAPLGALPEQVRWAQACDVVLAAFDRLGPVVSGAARDLLAAGAVDARPNPRKRRGALTFNLGGGDALVVLTFTGRPRDVLTLGHEMGHAVHARLSGPLGPLTATCPTVFAESVALFTESLTAHTFAQFHPAPDTRLGLMCLDLEAQLVALFRQLALHDFEDRVHRAVWAGERPGAETLNGWWLDGQRRLYGPALDLTQDYRTWWSYLDNFYFAPGSRFAYALGQLAASAQLSLLETDGDAFRQRFADVLAAGATQPPVRALARLGVRLDDPRAALDLLHQRVRDLAAQAPERGRAVAAFTSTQGKEGGVTP